MQSGGPGKGIEMVFVEGSFRNSRNGPSQSDTSVDRHHVTYRSRLDLVHVSCHQLDPGILKAFATLVVHGDPTHQVDGVAFVGSNNVVIGFPGQAPGYVGKFGTKRSSLIGRQQPLQRRLQHAVVAQRRKHRSPGQPEAQLALDFDDRLFIAALGVGHLCLVVL